MHVQCSGIMCIVCVDNIVCHFVRQRLSSPINIMRSLSNLVVSKKIRDVLCLYVHHNNYIVMIPRVQRMVRYTYIRNVRCHDT